MAYHRQQGVDTCIVRIFNTYGPRLSPDDGRVVSNLICQALSGEDITVFGDGLQTRAFCYVADLIEGLLRLMAYDDGQPGPVNVGNPAEMTIRELVDLVLDLTGSASRIVHCALPVDDPKRRRPDISKARTLLDWEPRTSLENGLRQTIAWFEAQADKVARPTPADKGGLQPAA